MVCTCLQLEAISTYLYVDYVGVRCDGIIHFLLSFFFWMVLFVYLFRWASHTDFSEDGDCCDDSRIPATSDKAVVLHLNMSWSSGTYQGLRANICAERCPDTNGTKGVSISAGSLCTIDRDLDDDSYQQKRHLLTEWCHFITARKCMRVLQYSSGRHEEIPISHPWSRISISFRRASTGLKMSFDASQKL